MTIKEFSKCTGLSTYTLRYYEEKGLIRVKRDQHNQRMYEEQDIAWMLFVKRLKDTGMLLNDIKTYADLRYLGDETIKQRLHILLEHRTYVLQQQLKWAEYLENLDQKIELYEKQLE